MSRLPTFRFTLALLFLVGCGGSSRRVATPEVQEHVTRTFHSGCIDPSGTVLVLGRVGIRVADGVELWRGPAGQLVYCDSAGAVFTARSTGESPRLSAWLVTYQSGRVTGDESIPLPPCVGMGTLYTYLHPRRSEPGFSWHVLSSPEQEEGARCDERGGVRIDPTSGALNESSFVQWEASTLGAQAGLEAADGIHIYESISSTCRTRTNQVAAVRDGHELWRREVPGLAPNDNCRP